MISYGLAFVVGYLFSVTLAVAKGKETYPWSPRIIVWGFVFMGLNWVAGLGG